MGSGARANAVVPTAMDKIMQPGEMVMIGIAPRWKGYSGVCGDTLPVSESLLLSRQRCIKHVGEVMFLTRHAPSLRRSGKEIDAPGRDYFIKQRPL